LNEAVDQGIATAVSFRRFLGLMIAAAMLLAPALTAGSAFAAVPDHHAQATEAGHCDPAPAEQPAQPISKSHCIAMCMAIAVAPASTQLAGPAQRSANAPAMPCFPTSQLPEIATPPPRAA
jgi:hypothetical protein